jgi:hypothetical protein
MLFRPPSIPKSNRVVTGKSLAHRKMSVAERALLAADIWAGEVDFKPTLGQLARDARVSVPSAWAAGQIRHDPAARFDVLTASCSLRTAAARHRNRNGNGRKGPEKAMTPAAWAKADVATRRQFISSLGIASVWDVVEILTR